MIFLVSLPPLAQTLFDINLGGFHFPALAILLKLECLPLTVSFAQQLIEPRLEFLNLCVFELVVGDLHCQPVLKLGDFPG